MKKDRRFKAQNLRSLLSLLFVIVLLAGGALFYLGLNEVRDYSKEVNQQIANAEASEKKVTQLQNLKNRLAESNQLVDKANQLFSTPNNYQARALADIERYASVAGLSTTGTSFGDQASTTVTVKFQSPVSYRKLLTFLSLVESNLPKMQVTSINLGYPDDGNPENVRVGDIKINVSVR